MPSSRPLNMASAFSTMLFSRRACGWKRGTALVEKLIDQRAHVSPHLPPHAPMVWATAVDDCKRCFVGCVPRSMPANASAERAIGVSGCDFLPLRTRRATSRQRSVLCAVTKSDDLEAITVAQASLSCLQPVRNGERHLVRRTTIAACCGNGPRDMLCG